MPQSQNEQKTVVAQPANTTQSSNTANPVIEVAPVMSSTEVASALPQGSNWFDLGIAFAWPVTVAVLVIYFRTTVRRVLVRLADRLKRASGSGFEFSDTVEEGTAPAPPAADAPADVVQGEGRSVLATLWIHHHKHVGDDFSAERWSFRIPPNDDRYIRYLTGLSQTVRAGLVTVSPTNLQCLLTNAGVEYCRQHKDEMTPEIDLYK